MKRRTLLKAGVGTGVLVGAGAIGFLSLKDNSNAQFASLEEVLRFIESVPSTIQVSHSGVWNAFQTFTHIAQSIEFSLFGYPQLKSSLFRSTLGPLAFSVFSMKGASTHALDEPIPGAPVLVAQGNPYQSLRYLRGALLEFIHYRRELKPHFAYGELTKEEYTQAHLMHINEHFAELKFELTD